MLTNVGDEGGFAPSINTNEEALELMKDIHLLLLLTLLVSWLFELKFQKLEKTL